MEKAISIVVYDPSGNQKSGETYPPNSVWAGSTDWMSEPVRKSVMKQRREMNAPPEPKVCALGSKCLRAYRRKPAEVTGTGQYCSSMCRGTAQALAKRSQQVGSSEVVCNPA